MQLDLNDLLSKITILEAENSALSEKAEDSMLFGTVAELIYQTDDTSLLIEQILERISILKNIPFCACFDHNERGINVIGYYALFGEFQPSDIQLSFPEFTGKIHSGESFLILEKEDFESHNFSFLIKGQYFQPLNALIIRCLAKSIPDKYFLFLDNSQTENQFSKIIMPLLQVSKLATERLDKIFIFNELSRLNQELDKRVNERTTELTRINDSLNKEIIERKVLLRALAENEKKLRSVFNAAIDVSFIIVDLSKDFIIRSFSPGSVKMFGYKATEVIGHSLEILHLPDQTNLMASIERDLTRLGVSRKEEIILCRKSGEFFPAILTVHPLRDDDGNVVGALSVSIDITELKKVENEFIKAKEKAEESDRLKTAFLQNMSHEIRTPMNAIIGFADLLPEYFGDEERLIKYANIIKERGADLLEIISGILDIAKIESGQLPVNPEKCRMNDLFENIETLFDDFRKRNNNINIEYKLKVDQSIKMMDVIIDQVKLKQILFNLIGNANKFTRSGRIEVGCSLYEADIFTFYVSDTGIGIPKEKHVEIFSRFMQGSNDTSRFYGGTGLGLSIVQGLLNLLGGKIWIESEPGKGSTFFFTFPFTSNGQQALKISETKEKEIRISYPTLNILIVEDNEFNAEYLVEILSDTNNNVTQTRYGRKAVEICRQQEIDLVLMDIRLPDITGYEAIKQIRELNREIKIFVQTAYATSDDEQKALDAGCDEYLSKPIRRELLLAKINHHLNGHFKMI
ncbi:MAG: ATP-binding protein [Bacteroidota bacterium]|nr:ATP-binding protein [Bacteroidota bacterium]